MDACAGKSLPVELRGDPDFVHAVATLDPIRRDAIGFEDGTPNPAGHRLGNALLGRLEARGNAVDDESRFGSDIGILQQGEKARGCRANLRVSLPPVDDFDGNSQAVQPEDIVAGDVAIAPAVKNWTHPNDSRHHSCPL